ncbi:hypothetical protein PMI06_008725 [Burkholderia sp. BT03]|nr:hypothetical protein PMI06_008725 [Burkholderia sp. BT03]SKC51836.1 hypothetical protein SAMN06266956_0465 [Paraburkholderia hospita]
MEASVSLPTGFSGAHPTALNNFLRLPRGTINSANRNAVGPRDENNDSYPPSKNKEVFDEKPTFAD